MSPNQQKPFPTVANPEQIIVHSVWPTVQGEGPFAGTMALFIRLYGCNLQCPWCDTDYTSKATTHSTDDALEVPSGSHLSALIKQLRALTPIRNDMTVSQRQLVVITGGEPFRQAGLTVLVARLIEEGFQVQIETNGTLNLDIHRRAVVVCSPKTPKINPALAVRVNAYKYVLDADHVSPTDGLPSGTLGKYGETARPPFGWEGDVFLQPLDEADPVKNKNNLEACVRSVLRYGYRLCIQTHKLANLP